MPLNSSRYKSTPPLMALFCALLGLAWCGYVAFPTSLTEPCLTSGCAVTKNFAIAGISLWWIGGGCFFIISFLCLRNMRFLAWHFSRLVLFFDALFLLLMLVTGPCFDCLVVAFFFAVTNYLLRPTPETWFLKETEIPRFVLLPIWLGLFVANSILAINETTPALTMTTETSNPSVRVYFAPSCPACRDAVMTFGEQAELFPVLESDSDFGVIYRMQELLVQGATPQKALSEAMDSPASLENIPLSKKFFLAIGLLRNKANLFKHGFTSLPLIEVNGMPKAWISKKGSLGIVGDALITMPQNMIKNQEERENQSSVQESLAPADSKGTEKGDSVAPDFLNVNDIAQCGEDKPCE